MSYTGMICMFCYQDEKQYNDLKSFFRDGSSMPETFREWKEAQEKNVEELEREGYVVKRFYPEETSTFINFFHRQKIYASSMSACCEKYIRHKGIPHVFVS
ncbi:hypothetical protein [Klebsiella aerogenes]|uniref:hypothetical protein n=1 Tax=Klebsiella aerogenes TaxID=548 RepID=UPI001F2BD7D4|nr:hypothetical protein [Klebsiella aerogenes]